MTDIIVDTPSTPIEAIVPETVDTPVTDPVDAPHQDTPAEENPAIDVLDGMSPEELTAIIQEAMKPRPTEPVSFPEDTAKKDEIIPVANDL